MTQIVIVCAGVVIVGVFSLMRYIGSRAIVEEATRVRSLNFYRNEVKPVTNTSPLPPVRKTSFVEPVEEDLLLPVIIADVACEALLPPIVLDDYDYTPVDLKEDFDFGDYPGKDFDFDFDFD